MTFVSYAQNYEDVMLWRALKHIEKGFYIDVGANDPIIDSVTQAFYERGWRGINIEPVNSYYEHLCSARPLDINLPVAVANTEGELNFYEIPDTGLSTINDEIAQKQRTLGWEVHERKVFALTLNQIIQKHIDGPIHFLKIDVEGAEGTVLQGMDLTRWRPWILIIESTTPSSSESNFESWESSVLAAKYKMAYFDGLNRFYVADEQSAITEQLKTPPNIFDDFISIKQKNALDQIEMMQKELSEIKADREKIRIDRDGVRDDLQGVRIDLKGVRADLDTMRTERDKLSSEFNQALTTVNRLQLEQKELQVNLEVIRAELNNVRTDRDLVQTELNSMRADRDRIQTQLDEVWASRDLVLAELDGVYHSRSYRITAPLRAVFGTARIIKHKLIQPINQRDSLSASESNGKSKVYLHQLVNYIRRVPWISILLDRIKRRFPRQWVRLSSWVKTTIRIEHKPPAAEESIASTLSSFEDEKHFLDLFKRELTRRQAGKTELEA